MNRFILYYFIAINIISFTVYGLDKLFAIKHRWRVKEATLLMLAGVGGSVGALSGMYMFRHKTKKLKFTVCVPLILLLQAAVVCYLMYKMYIAI